MVAVTATLLPATVEQRGAVLDLLRKAGLPVADLEGDVRPEFIVALDGGGEIVGAVGVEAHGNDALLRSLAVEPAWRGHGIGDALVQAAEHGARLRGVEALWLLTTDASAYFIARGYAFADRDRAPSALQNCAQFRSLCPFSAACLRKTLD
jgi:amino-acid N-acetyltransferase